MSSCSFATVVLGEPDAFLTLNPAVNSGMIDIYPSLSQHLLQLTITNAIFAVPADGPRDNMTLKMPTFEWVHVLLLQLQIH